jgi:xylan 1,4-beta-xylosidase
MINIPSGSKGEDDYLDPENFAKFCADLVKIVNIDHGLGIKYWEIPNEREEGFVDPGLSASKMAILIKTATTAMKAVDSSIKVGGSATAWVNIDYLSQLVDALYPNIDFITAHSYSGDGTNSLKNAYDVAQFATADLAELRSRINIITGNNYLPIFLSEYNISFQGEPRIQTYEGALYNAIILTESITAGADATMYWNMAPYSDMSLLDGDTRDKNVHLFEIFNKSFHGNLLNSKSEETGKVSVYAVSNQVDTNIHAFSLINRTENLQDINVTFNNWLPSEMVWHLSDASNDFTTRNTNWADLKQGNFTLSPYSVNLFIAQ